MIISHSREFIFFRPRKVAGTSLQIAFGTLCKPGDTVTGVNPSDPFMDQDEYTHRARCRIRGAYNHATPVEIRRLVGGQIWKDYWKITVVRNPWDAAVSWFYWLSRRSLTTCSSFDDVRVRFNRFVKRRAALQNEPYYFFENGAGTANRYMRFERLESEFASVCDQLGATKRDIPHAKTKLRRFNEPYAAYYEDESKEIIATSNAKTIDFFDYKFGQD